MTNQKNWANSESRTLLFVCGTRHEAIKLVPLILEVDRDSSFRSITCVSGQQKEMVKEIFDFFQISPHYDLNGTYSSQNTVPFLSKTMSALEKLVEHEHPYAIIVQGQSTTVLAASLVAALRRIPLIHLENESKLADLQFPDERNRLVSTQLTNLHVVANIESKKKLLTEKENSNAFLGGNTLFDAFRLTKIMNEKCADSCESEFSFVKDEKFIILNCTRKESFGSAYKSICEAVLTLVEENSSLHIVYPVELNPNFELSAHQTLSHPRIHLLNHVPFHQMVYLMTHTYAVITDNLWIHEKALFFKKPTVVLRDVVDSAETIHAKVLFSTTKSDQIIQNVTNLLEDESFYKLFIRPSATLEEGHASARILQIIKNYQFTKDDNNMNPIQISISA